MDSFNNLATQSKVALLMGILLALGGGIYLNTEADFRAKDAGLLTMSILVTFLIVAYNANCVVKGHCGFWGWLTVIIHILSVGGGLYLLSLLVDAFQWMKNSKSAVTVVPTVPTAP